MQISYNFSKRTDKIKYIVIHDTGNKGKGANALSHFQYFNGGDRQSSADIFVDDKQILPVNDYEKYYSWHCGDGKGKNNITNNNSIGIELCINSDGDYNKAFNNLITITKELMAKYNISVDRVVRHFDASGKNCPQTMGENNWEKWKEFKSMLTEKNKYSYDNTVEHLIRLGITSIDNMEYWEKCLSGTEELNKDNVRAIFDRLISEVYKK